MPPQLPGRRDDNARLCVGPATQVGSATSTSRGRTRSRIIAALDDERQPRSPLRAARTATFSLGAVRRRSVRSRRCPGSCARRAVGPCGWSRLCRCRCPGPRGCRGVAPARSRRCPGPRAVRAAAPRGAARVVAVLTTHAPCPTTWPSPRVVRSTRSSSRARVPRWHFAPARGPGRTGRFCHLGDSRLDAAGVTTVPGVAAGCGRLPVAGARGTETGARARCGSLRPTRSAVLPRRHGAPSPRGPGAEGPGAPSRSTAGHLRVSARRRPA